MNKYRKSISIIVAIVMLFTLQFSFSFAETADESDPIVILHTNDMHSKVDGELSLASVKGWKDYYEAKGSAVLILDSGDALHGLPVANLSRGENIVDIMNEVGYTAMTPGNHDFNYGTARLKELSELMDFDLLSANFTDKSGTAVFTPSKIYTAGDKKIGIVGISTPETATKTNPLNVAGYQFNEAELASLVQAQIDSLKAEGADYIVALGHLGLDEESEPYRSSDLISQISGLDIFVDGHSHTSLANGEAVKDKDGNEVVLAQTGSQLKAIGKIGIDGENIAASLITEPKEDAAIKALEAEQQTEIQPMLDKVVAKTDVLLDGNRDPGVRTQETNLGDLGADALKYVSGADVALTNGGGIRASIEIGDITYGEINTVFPFGNTVVTIEITGADLLAALQHGTASAPTASGGFPQVAGMNYEVHTYLQADRVQNVTINGEPLDLQKTYTLATNDFTQVGGDGYTMLAGYEKTGEYGALDEALATYIEKALNGTVDNRYAKAQNRIKVMLTPYTDMVSHWAGASVATVVNKNLFKGVSETSFLPNASMTRAMFITVLGRMDGVDIAAYQSTEFEDVTMDSWYGAYVEWADDNEIASGITETKFAPETPITREQMATILTNYCTYKGQGPVGAWAIQLKYTDLERVSDWAGEGVMFATMKAYMTGYADGSFGPQNKATRAETAVIISRFLAAQEPITTTGSGITR
ncbi:MAG: 5'-nucleotidase C-terminal domain-containing protein [Clostridia bacterium]|nr:5'-nucleotidase C-terminal domain-containing protein [Clostridia bacterium]